MVSLGMSKYVIDTNLFFNMGSGLDYGTKTEDVVSALTRRIKAAKKERFAVFVPPRVVEEFLSFFENKEQAFIKHFLSVVTIKSPEASAISLSAPIFYEMVADVRERSYRGLRVGEEEIVAAAQAMMESSALSKPEFQKKVGEFVRGFRDRYRNATRTGFLDSVADLDLIILSKEQDAYLVSADEGVVRWGRKFGIKEVTPAVFGSTLKEAAQE